MLKPLVQAPELLSHSLNLLVFEKDNLLLLINLGVHQRNLFFLVQFIHIHLSFVLGLLLFLQFALLLCLSIFKLLNLFEEIRSFVFIGFHK